MMRLPRQVWVVFVLGTLNSLGWGATMPFLAVYLEVERHVPLSIIGLAYLVSGLVTLVSQLLGGRLTDSLGSKTILLIGYSSSIVTSIVIGLTIEFRASVEIILLLYPIFSFVRTFSQPAAYAIVAGESSANLRTGFSIISIGGNLGWAIGPALGGILAQIYRLFGRVRTQCSFRGDGVGDNASDGGGPYSVETSQNPEGEDPAKLARGQKLDYFSYSHSSRIYSGRV